MAKLDSYVSSLNSPSAAGSAWDPMDWDFCLSGASFRIRVLKRDDL